MIDLKVENQYKGSKGTCSVEVENEDHIYENRLYDNIKTTEIGENNREADENIYENRIVFKKR